MGEFASLEAVLKDKCWAQKVKHDKKLQGGFEGYRNSAERFKNKVLQEQATNTATLLTLAALENMAESVFGTAPTKEASVPAVDMSNILAYEKDPILKKRVIGKEDVDISAMIKKLGNSDWIREGRGFYEANSLVCPFCQQETTDSFAKSLNDYFDETFLADSKAIDDLAKNYAAEGAEIQRQIHAIITAPASFWDVEKLKAEKALLDSKLTVNKQRLDGKKKEISREVELESLSDVCRAVSAILDDANAQIDAHNDMVENLATERAALTAHVWRFVLEELTNELAAYNKAKGDLNKGIAAMIEQISEHTKLKSEKADEIRESEKQITSIKPTIDGINGLLLAFGFEGFKLAEATSGISYKLVRSDGSDAMATLSEGEKTFVTFLYFYHLLKGSESDTGMTSNRIVVFDDPVSSLDSDILFIVGSLIKGLFDEVRDGVGQIKQIFVLTHNVYFHKEVTYNPKRSGSAMNEETFWIVRKPRLLSKLEKYSTNPIKTSYELLWAEVRNPDRSNLAIQNTLRRILENYFKILGGIDFDDLCALFSGKERLICKSLCSWAHDGSHYAHDDLYISIDDTMVAAYLRVFKAIFEKSQHGAHYKMMMAEAYADDAIIGDVA